MRILLTLLIYGIASCSILLGQCDNFPDEYLSDECGDNHNVNFKATGVATFCENQVVTFKNETAGPPGYYDKFIIDWGDGSPCEEVTHYNDVTHTFNFQDIDKCKDGPKFNATMRFIGIKSCPEGTSSAGAPRPYQVKLAPVADFNYATVVCVNTPTTFQNTSCNENKDHYEWDFDGDGITDSTDESPSYTFTNTGIYSVTLKVSNDCGDHEISKTVTVVGVPEASIKPSIPEGKLCGAGRLDLDIDGNEWATGPSSTIKWKITPGYTNSMGKWCFDNPGPGPTCLHDSILTPHVVDSLLSLESLDLYFREPGEYYVELAYSNVCDMKVAKDTIHVYEPVQVNNFKNVSGCDKVEVCYNDLGVTIDGDYSDVKWTFTGGSVATSDVLDFGCVTFDQSGSILLEVDAESPCKDVSAMIDVTVVTMQNVSIADITDPICQNGGLVPLSPSPPGGVYLFNGSPATFISGDMLDPSMLDPDSYEVTYSLSNDSDCPAEDSFTFTIQQGPFIELGEIEPECEKVENFNPRVINASGDIDGWNWRFIDESGTEVYTSTNENPQFTSPSHGTYTIIAELSSDECGIYRDTTEVIIQEKAIASIDPFNNPYCQGSSPDTLMASPAGGTWNGTGITDTQEGVFDPSQVDPGTYTIRYMIESGACSSTATADIEVVASETVTARDTFVCITGTAITLDVEPSGGTWIGGGITAGSQGVFDPAVLGVGVHTVMYEYTDANNCMITTSVNVEVDSIPMIMVADTTFICIGEAGIQLSEVIPVDANGVEGQVVYTGDGINSSTGIFDGSALAAGFYKVDVLFEGRSCSTQDSFVIELAPKPELILPADSTVCVSEGSLSLSANIPGGKWTSSDCQIDEDSGTITFQGGGTCTVRYTLSEGTSCEQSGEVRLEIIDMDATLSVPPPSSICYSDAIHQLSGFSPSGGTWSGEGIVDQSLGGIQVSQLKQDTTYTYQYCVQHPTIDCEACKETTITIEALPSAMYSIEGSPCQGKEFQIVNNSSENAASFSWDFGDGGMSMDKSPSYTYQTAGDYTMTMVARTTFGCADTIIQVVHVTAPPTIAVSIDTDEGCAPLKVAYTNTSSGENITQYWVIDQQDTINGATPEIILDGVLTDSIITVELVVQNDCEVLRSSKDILVHPYPVVDFGIRDDEGCSPDTVYFMDATLGQPETYIWDFGNGETYTDNDPPLQVYTSPDDSISMYTITLSASNMCGSDTLEKTITVYPNNIDAFFEIDTLSGCPPLDVNIKNYATVGSTVTYDFGDGNTGAIADTVYTYTKPGKYVITQYAQLCGIDSTRSDTIVVHELPTLSFEAPSYVCIGDTARFLNTSTDGLYSEWIFGDGNTSSATNPTHVYAMPGTYDVQLIMYSKFSNCPDTLTKKVLVPVLPVAAFDAIPPASCPGEYVVFKNQSFGAVNYQWDFGDASGSEEKNPRHAYPSPGTYEVTLKVYDEYGCSNDTTSINVLVHEAPESAFTINSPSLCQFYDTLKTTNTSKGFISSEWYIDDVLVESQRDDLVTTLDMDGEKEIRLISINSFGCRDTSTVQMEILPSPLARTSTQDTAGCQALSIFMNDISLRSDQRTWLLDGMNTSNDKEFSHTFVDKGVYNVRLIASNSNGCPSDTVDVSVEVYPRAVAGYEVVDLDSCGAPKQVQFSNTSLFSSDYNWNFGNGAESNLLNPSIVYSDPGEYTIVLEANNQYNCPSTIQKKISIYPQPRADVSLPEYDICEGDTLKLVNNSVNSTHYELYLNGEKVESSPVIIAQQGTYTLEVVTYYEDKCKDSHIFNNKIEVFNTPVSDFAYVANEDGYVLGDVRFINLSEDAETYKWEFGDGGTSGEKDPSYEYDKNGPVTVCLYAIQNNQGKKTCTDKSSEVIEYETIHTFFVPNALSPNQNFGNDEVGVFKPKGVGVKSYELNVYSPWGDKVITLDQVLDGEPVDYWDGSFRGSPAPQGAYKWTARIEYLSGHTEFKKGDVTIVR